MLQLFKKKITKADLLSSITDTKPTADDAISFLTLRSVVKSTTKAMNATVKACYDVLQETYGDKPIEIDGVTVTPVFEKMIEVTTAKNAHSKELTKKLEKLNKKLAKKQAKVDAKVAAIKATLAGPVAEIKSTEALLEQYTTSVEVDGAFKYYKVS